jgi:hypothetical protein
VRDQYHNELQWYTGRRPENAWVSDGTLKITARREDKWADAPYTSARLNTRGKGDFKYGRIEASPCDPPFPPPPPSSSHYHDATALVVAARRSVAVATAVGVTPGRATAGENTGRVTATHTRPSDLAGLREAPSVGARRVARDLAPAERLPLRLLAQVGRDRYLRGTRVKYTFGRPFFHIERR